jgi:hypothetical protein
MTVATRALPGSTPTSGTRFFWRMAVGMAAIVVVGFSFNLMMGRSSFDAPVIVHVHAVAFMGWVALFVTQARLGTFGPIEVHRWLGRIAAAWIVVLIALGIAVTIDRIQRGSTPFFFRPQEFLLANSLGILVCAGLVWTAVRMRRRLDWHRRLQVGAMSSIMGPAFGRLLPMPFLIPYAFETAVLAGLVFPVIGMVHDRRTLGHIHPAWWVAVLATLATLPAANLLARSSAGNAIYAIVTKGTPGAAVPGMAFGPLPPEFALR